MTAQSPQLNRVGGVLRAHSGLAHQIVGLPWISARYNVASLLPSVLSLLALIKRKLLTSITHVHVAKQDCSTMVNTRSMRVKQGTATTAGGSATTFLDVCSHGQGELAALIVEKLGPWNRDIARNLYATCSTLRTCPAINARITTLCWEPRRIAVTQHIDYPRWPKHAAPPKHVLLCLPTPHPNFSETANAVQSLRAARTAGFSSTLQHVQRVTIHTGLGNGQESRELGNLLWSALMPNVQEISMSCSNIGSHLFFKRMSHLSQLQALDLNRVQISGQSVFNQLQQITHLQQLTKLSITDLHGSNHLDLSALSALSNLSSIHLCAMPMFDDHELQPANYKTINIAALGVMPALASVSIDCAYVVLHDMDEMAHAANSITSLALSGPLHVPDSCAALHWPRLQQFAFDGTFTSSMLVKLGSKAAGLLAQHLESQLTDAVTGLVLGYGASDAAAVKLLRSTNVTRLGLAMPLETEEDIEQFIRCVPVLKPLAGQLQHLHLHLDPNCCELALPAEVIKAIAKALPRLTSMDLIFHASSEASCDDDVFEDISAADALLYGLPQLQRVHVGTQQDVGYLAGVMLFMQPPGRQLTVHAHGSEVVLQAGNQSSARIQYI